MGLGKNNTLRACRQNIMNKGINRYSRRIIFGCFEGY
jgi:hypothetical protein